MRVEEEGSALKTLSHFRLLIIVLFLEVEGLAFFFLIRVVAVDFSNFHFHFTNLQLWKIEKVAKRGRSDFTIGSIKRAGKLRILMISSMALKISRNLSELYLCECLVYRLCIIFLRCNNSGTSFI